MENIIRLTQEKLQHLINFRSGEIKFGEQIVIVPKNNSISDFIQKTNAKYVLFGVPEDVGVRANFGKKGTASAYHNALYSIVNIQHNELTKASDLLILGHLNTEDYQEKAKNLNPKKPEELQQLYQIVTQIDKDVSHLVSIIVKNEKIPIAIGGGHNNAYGLIKGTALGKAEAINTINFDAHSDFRSLEGRHSGNGFSYAYHQGFLNRYFIFGLHENYTSKNVFQRIKENVTTVQYNTYEQIAVRREVSFSRELKRALEFIETTSFGIEIDLDAIENVLSSAITPSGFSVEKLRRFLHFFASNPKVAYLHICEGSPDLSDEKRSNQIGKLVAYLVTDFIKAT